MSAINTIEAIKKELRQDNNLKLNLVLNFDSDFDFDLIILFSFYLIYKLKN